MNISNFDHFNISLLFRNVQSEKIGFYFSFGLHLIFLFFVIGFPNFFKSAPIQVPNIIPIEIINVTDTTSIPKEIKNKEIEKNNKKKEIQEKPKKNKFNSITQQPKPTVDIKNKPEEKIENIKIKEKIIIEEDKKNLDDLKKDLIINEEKFESLPSVKIKPKIKPKPTNIETVIKDTDIEVKVKSKPKPKETFNIDTMLKDLRHEKSSLNVEKNETEEKEKIKNKEENEAVPQLSISEIDLLIKQLSSCWSAPAGAVIKKGMVVKVSAKIKPDKRILYESIRIVDTNISKSNPFYGPITESATRTLLNPECNPLMLPTDKYDLWKNLTIIFDHSIMKGYE
tara:strand:+ start:10303 stop:11322 length:1020 start_codon:yes stop_codon:yes gene_type:complete